MLQQERAEALDLVVDAILAERPPIDAGVDREHRLVEPERAVDLTGKFARMSHSCRVRSRSPHLCGHEPTAARAERGRLRQRYPGRESASRNETLRTIQKLAHARHESRRMVFVGLTTRTRGSTRRGVR